MFVRGNLCFAIVAGAALAFSVASHADVWYVDKSNDSGTEDGTSWATAYSTIQPAIDAAHEDGGGEVWIAAGVYDEPREFFPWPQGGLPAQDHGSLVMREHVEIYGGFSGWETGRTSRDWIKQRTVIDGSTSLAGEHAIWVIFGASHTVLDGLTVTGAYADPTRLGLDHKIGGGLMNWRIDDVHVSNCSFVDNQSNFGAGVANYSARDLIFKNCTFADNRGLEGGAGLGTAMYNYRARIQVVDCHFVRNGGNDPSGEGIVVYGEWGETILDRCEFRSNRQIVLYQWENDRLPGFQLRDCDFIDNDSMNQVLVGVYAQYYEVTNCSFVGNRSLGRAMLHLRDGFWDADSLTRHPISTVIGSVFTNNVVDSRLIYMNDRPVISCTFSGNTVLNLEGTILYRWVSRIRGEDREISDCIFWNDTPTEIFIDDFWEMNEPQVKNTIVRGGVQDSDILDVDPQVRDLEGGDPRLRPTSPAVDMSLEIFARPYDIIGVALPQGAKADLGAFELEFEQPMLCETGPEIEAALGRLRFVAELYGDLDEDGLPEIASLRLLNAAACAYDTSKGFAAERAFELNLDAVDDEPFDMRILRKRELIAALMAVGEETQRTVRDAFAEEGVVLLGSYAVVACDETGICETVFIDAASRGAVPVTMDEPFPGPGDYDLDGLTNSQEWAGVMSQGGGLDEFIRAATDPTIRATVASASSGGCFIATAAYGTPLAAEIDILRALRDRHLLTNAFGAAFTDTYYRLSPPLADTIAGNPTLRAAARFSIGVVLSSIEILRTLHGWILMLGLALTVAAAIRRGARAT